MKKLQKKRKKEVKYKKVIVIILGVLFVLLPWITYLKIREYNEAEQTVFGGYGGIDTDMFVYYKTVIFLAAAAFVICWFLGEFIFVADVDKNVPLLKGKNNRKYFVLFGIFAVMTMLAVIFSENKKSALWGSPKEGEGLFVLLGYFVIAFAFYNYFATDYGVKAIKKMVAILAVITVALAFLEFFYKSIFETDAIRYLLGPESQRGTLENLSYAIFNHAVCISFNNPNYFGGFVCIILPFAVGLFAASEKIIKKIIYLMISVGLFACVIMSNAATATYVALFEIGIMFTVFAIKYRKTKYMIISGLTAAALIAAVSLLFSAFTDKNLSGLLKNENARKAPVEKEDFYYIRDIKLSDNEIIIYGKDNYVALTYNDGKIIPSYNGEELAYKTEDGTIYLDEKYRKMSVRMTDYSGVSGVVKRIFVDAGYDASIKFYVLKDGTVSGAGQNGRVLKDIYGEMDNEKYEKYYGKFTGRGFAWINSLPVIKDTLLIGKGPGNFPYYFKQYNYVGMLNTHGSTNYIIDKPHNTYIQMTVNIGLAGMAAYFGFIVLVLWDGAKAVKKNRKLTEGMAIQISGMTAAAGFLIYSCLNDSLITVTPVMWMVIGITMAMTYKNTLEV